MYTCVAVHERMHMLLATHPARAHVCSIQILVRKLGCVYLCIAVNRQDSGDAVDVVGIAGWIVRL